MSLSLTLTQRQTCFDHKVSTTASSGCSWLLAAPLSSSVSPNPLSLSVHPTLFLRRFLAKWNWWPVFIINIVLTLVNLVAFTGFGIFYNIKVNVFEG